MNMPYSKLSRLIQNLWHPFTIKGYYGITFYTQQKMAEASSSNGGVRLAGKVAIITGGASGIGKETAHVFAEQGARMVVIADIQDELGNQVAASIGIHRCTYIHCDVRDEVQVKNLVHSTVETYGQVNIFYIFYYNIL